MRTTAKAGLVGAAVLFIAAVANAEAGPRERLAHRSAPPPAASARTFRSGQAELAEQFRVRRPKPEELQTKLRELQATTGARRDAHRAALRAALRGQFGDELGRKDLRDELGKHARRVAFLNRAKLVASTELDEPKRGATLTRIDKLLSKEQARHDAAVQELRSPATVATGSRTKGRPE